MAANLGFHLLNDFRGGRNGADAIIDIPDTQCAEAINVDWYRGTLGRRRPGAMTSIPPATGVLDHAIFSLIRFVPGASNKATELFAFDTSGLFARYRSGVGWFGPHPPGSLNETGGIVHGVSFNNKLFLAGKNSTDQLHYWDPAQGILGTAGVPRPAAGPWVQSSGVGGTVTGTRYYRYAWVEYDGPILVRRGEASAVSSYTISGTPMTGWFITRGDELEFAVHPPTHWELYAAAAAGGPWYLLQLIPAMTISVPDLVAPASFPPLNTPLAPIIGSNTPAPNGKYLLVDEARLLIAGSYTDPKLESRVWWTPILNDASGSANDERINLPQRPFIDFDPGDTGEITGMGGPLFDSPYIFKLDRVYKMVRTGLAQAAYRPVTVSKKCGAIHQRTIVLAEDETGNEAIYFLSRRGPFRVGINGVQYCGRDIEDLWAMVNLNAAMGTIDNAGAHGVYHADIHQVWWWVPLLNHDHCPRLKLVFDTRLGQFTQVDGVRRGWAQHTGDSARAWCSSMFADTVDLPENPDEDSLILKPFISQGGKDETLPPDDVSRLWMCDVGTLDDGQGYLATLISKGLVLSQTVALHSGILEAHVIIGPTGGANQRFLLAAHIDYGAERRASELTPFDAPPARTRVIVAVRDLGAVSAAVIQIEFTDDVLSDPWELDQIVLRTRREEDR